MPYRPGPFAVVAALVLASSVLVACASTPSQARQAKRAQYESTIPTCDGEADCAVKWESAQRWLARSAGFKNQALSGGLIDASNPGFSDGEIAARVSQEPLGGGKYKLVVTFSCSNGFGCAPNQWDAAINFNTAVGAAKP